MFIFCEVQSYEFVFIWAIICLRLVGNVQKGTRIKGIVKADESESLEGKRKSERMIP